MLFCNGFSVELSKFEANIERDRKKEVEHNMSTIFLQLTQVLMSQIVVKNFATLCCIRKIHSLHKTKTFVSTFYKHKLHLLALLSLFTYLTYTRNLKNFPFWAEPPPGPCRARVVKSSWLLPKIAIYMYLVCNGRLLCLAFLYRWRFLNKISLDWPLTLTTQLSTLELSDNLV